MVTTSQPASPGGPAQKTQGWRMRWLPELRRGEMWTYFGPAFVASVAYIDPGNFAANIEGGTRFGYKLLWVLLWSNAMAILVQYLSAKLGIVSGHTLPQNCRRHFSRPATIGLWIAAEISAIATDLAEFLGAALGFYLLFGAHFLALGWDKTHIMLLAALLTSICVFLILALDLYGFRYIEWAIMAFVSAIAFCYAIEVFLVHPDWKLAAFHTMVPMLDGSSLYVAVAMLGATVMPHVVYLHSALVQPRLKQASANCPTGRSLFVHRYLRFELLDVFIAMNGAWLINSAMILMAAVAFAHLGGVVPTIEEAHRTLGPLLGSLAATAFAIALLCSGLSSSTVGTMAGQVIIEGFLDIRFPVFLRRLITIIPAIVIIAIGLDPLRILLLSQVVLSFTLPFALVPLLILTGRSSVMAGFANGISAKVLGWLTTGIIIVLNALLLAQLLHG